MILLDSIKKEIVDLEDVVLKRRVVRATTFTLFILFSMFIAILVYILQKEYLISIFVFSNALIVIGNFIYFYFKRNFESFPNKLSLIFLYIMLSANILGGLRGFGPYLIDIFILQISSLTNRKKAIIFCSILIVGNILVYLFGDNFSIIYNYQSKVSLDVFVKFTIVHIGVVLVAYINNKNLEKGYKELVFEKNKNKQLFLNLVHDLKTPLTILNNRIDLSIKNNKSNSDLISLKKTINDMSHNIVSIIDLEKKYRNNDLEHNKKLDLSNETYDIINSYKSLIEGSSSYLKFKIERNLYIKCTKLGYRKILTNILDNALKYNSENGNIFISVYSSSNKVILSVRDQGIGIDAENLSKIFEPYVQLQRGIRSNYGLGLGLAIVKTICNEIGALIEVKSDKKQGSTFTVIFNKIEHYKSGINEINGEIKQKSIISSTKFINNKKTLLIVDDHFEIRTLLYETLISQYNIILAKDGEEGISKLDEKIDLILTDLMMPKIDGISFIKSIKCLKIPVIFISAKSVDNKVLEGLNTGAIDFITKPFSINELNLKIKSILKFIENDRKDLINKITEKVTSCISNYNNTEIILSRDSLSILTSKEKEIVEFILEGVPQKEIAIKMNLSINTVKSHIQRIYKKYGVRNVTALLSKI